LSFETDNNIDYSSRRFWLWGLLGAYILLLSLSWFVQWQFPAEEQKNKYQSSHVVDVPALGYSMEFKYMIVRAEGSNFSPVLILPDALRDPSELIPFAESLSQRAGIDVIIPIYPLTSTDGKKISFSIESRGKQVSAFMESMELDTVHLAGYRYGGIILSEMAEQSQKSELFSLTFLTSMGIEEMHFLGNYSVNRSLYALMLPFITIWEYAIPHFGRFYAQPLNQSYISAMLEMDQRVVEDNLKNIRSPVLILHPEADSFVPLHIAKEIYRLVPHSKLIIPDETSESLKTDPDIWTKYLSDFIREAENNSAPTAESADPERIAESEQPFDYDDVDTLEGWALFTILIMLVLITLIAEDIACIAGGLLVATGILEFHHAVLACFTGILTADVFIYWIGRWVGAPVLTMVPFKWFIKKRDLEWAENMFEARGAEIIFATRFLPGTRFPTYLAAGMLRTSFPSFLIYFLAAISLWTPLLVGISALIGRPMIGFIDVYQEYALIVVILFIALIYIIIKYIVPLGTVSGRRKFYVKWIRLQEKFKGTDPN